MVDGTSAEPAARRAVQCIGACASACRARASDTGRPDTSAPEVRRFAAAARALQQQSRDEEQVVPVVQSVLRRLRGRTSSPAPIVRRRRSRRDSAREVTSLAEHLRRLVGDAKTPTTSVGRERIGHELRAALRSMRWTIESFGHGGRCALFRERGRREPTCSTRSCSRRSTRRAHCVASPTIPLTDLAARLAELGRANTVDRAIAAGFGPLDQPTVQHHRSRARALDPAPRPAPNAGALAQRPTPRRNVAGPRKHAAHADRGRSLRSSSSRASPASPSSIRHRSHRRRRSMTRRSFRSTTCSIADAPRSSARSRCAT